MNTDLNLSEPWPESVTVVIEVQYDHSAPEYREYCLAPCGQSPYVRVLLPRAVGPAYESQRLSFSELPGATLYLRSLSVLATHLFGSAEMAPRVRGMPLWRRMTFGISTLDNDVHQVNFELEVVDDGYALLRTKCRRNLPFVTRTVKLLSLDADPLRALLRVATNSVKPAVARGVVPVRSRVAQRPSATAADLAQHV